MYFSYICSWVILTISFLSKHQKQTNKTVRQLAKTVSVYHSSQEGSVLFNDALNTFSYGYWRRTYYGEDQSDSERENPLPPHMLFFPILLYAPARVLLYAPFFRQDSTYHGLCYTSRGTLVGTRNSSMGPPWRIDPMTHRTMSERSYHGATSRPHSSQMREVQKKSEKHVPHEQPNQRIQLGNKTGLEDILHIPRCVWYRWELLVPLWQELLVVSV